MSMFQLRKKNIQVGSFSSNQARVGLEFQAGRQRFFKQGSAMILTMFVLAGMLIVAMSGAYIVLVGITASGIQAQSTKAYFAAEAGTEEALWRYWKGTETHDAHTIPAFLFGGNLQSSNVSFEIYYTKHPHTYMSIGSFQSTKRSVEISF